MSETNKNTSNDFAVAMRLNIELAPVADLVRQMGQMDVPEDYEIDSLNKAYIKLVHELDKLYKEHKELDEIKPQPFWKRFDTLKTNTWQMHDYFGPLREDTRDLHVARVEKLCIIAGSNTPDLSPKQKEAVKQLRLEVKNYEKILSDATLEINDAIEESWYIPEYKLDYKTDGTIIVNDVLILKKAHIGSAVDQLLEQAMKNPNKLFPPKLGKTNRNLGTILSGAGFTPVLRQLFFPEFSEDGIIFRPVVSHEQAERDKIDTTELDQLLRRMNADYTFSE